MVKKGAGVTLYVKPTWSTCRKSVDFLKARGTPFEVVDLFRQPLDAAALKDLLGRLGLRPRDVLRAKDPAYAELGLADPKLGDARLIAAMAAHPGLIQRPIVARGRKAVVARPVERAAELLD